MVKWSIGGQSTSQANIGRLMRTFYNPLFQPDIYGLHDAFRKLVEVRERLAGREALTDEVLLPDRYNACRVQLYPSGGGFMGAHIDSRGVANMPEASGPFIQTLLLLTQRGLDYQSGGGFVVHNGVFCDSEKDGQTGDVVVYDGKTMHGVADVDPTVPVQANDLRGRAVAIATIYDKR
jgi:hypothetical protein